MSRKRNPSTADGKHRPVESDRRRRYGVNSDRRGSPQRRQAPTWEYQHGIRPLIDQTLGTTARSLESAANSRKVPTGTVSAVAEKTMCELRLYELRR